MLKYPDLRDHIFVYKLIPDELCDKIIARVDKRPWKDHKWYDAGLKQDIEEADSPEGAEETAPENGETTEPAQDTPAPEAVEDNESQEAADPTETDEQKNT